MVPQTPAMGRPSGDLPPGVEWAARAGYAAKGVVYAVIGGLAVQRALGTGGEISSTREALEELAAAPFGVLLLTVVTAGLAAYVLWRLVQAFLDPEGRMDDDTSTVRRWARRGFSLVSAGIYGLLAYYGVTILLAGRGGGGSSGGPLLADLMSTSWGRWLVGLVGAGIVVRGGLQLVKAYTESFRKRIRSFQFGPGTHRWVLLASRLGISARGVVFALVGGMVVHAAATRDPDGARGTEDALQLLVGHPWLLGAAGAGLVFYGLYQWVKARYRILGV
jgi:hypothetical protein